MCNGAAPPKSESSPFVCPALDIPHPGGTSPCVDSSEKEECSGKTFITVSTEMRGENRSRLVLTFALALKSTLLQGFHEQNDAVFACETDEKLDIFEVRSNGTHLIRKKVVFSEWKIGLCHVRPTAIFQIPVIKPDDGRLEVVMAFNGKPLHHISMNLAEESTNSVSWRRREEIHLNLLNIPADPAADIPTQACRGVELSRRNQLRNPVISLLRDIKSH
ncbi:uncharacterized protein LOC135830959 [Sycon ciliatum]|uniref:uncharacterized protein LOC135830955 n=1 Tax=Sycon ciliatum TaxID=27933 RepID=UPI0031F67462